MRAARREPAPERESERRLRVAAPRAGRACRSAPIKRTLCFAIAVEPSCRGPASPNLRTLSRGREPRHENRERSRPFVDRGGLYVRPAVSSRASASAGRDSIYANQPRPAYRRFCRATHGTLRLGRTLRGASMRAASEKSGFPGLRVDQAAARSQPVARRPHGGAMANNDRVADVHHRRAGAAETPDACRDRIHWLCQQVRAGACSTSVAARALCRCSWGARGTRSLAWTSSPSRWRWRGPSWKRSHSKSGVACSSSWAMPSPPISLRPVSTP